MVEPWVEGRPLDDLHLKCFNHPIFAVEILRWRNVSEVTTPAAETPARPRKQ
jgi:hypothetical protein